MTRLLLPFLLLAACTDGFEPMGPYCDFPWPVTAQDLDEAVDLEHTVLMEETWLASAEDYWYSDEIITSQGELERFLVNAPIINFPEIDFTETMILASFMEHNSCHPSIEAVQVRELPLDVARLDVHVDLQDVTCEETCEGVTVHAVIVAVDASYTGSVCTWLEESCAIY